MLKYIRHKEEGFIVWPKFPMDLGIWHKSMAKIVGGKEGLLSAGFIVFEENNLPTCMGGSESLGLDSIDGDTSALRKEWGVE